MPGPGDYLVGEEEKKQVEEVLETGYLSRYGREDNPRFKHKVYTLERQFAQKIGVNHSVAVNSGTSALMAALVALGVKSGDEVMVPGYTFIASISSTIAIGGRPVLTEVDESLNMDPKDVEKKITSKTKVILPVHMLGNPCDMAKIMKIADKHNLLVLEDCCQAVGGSFRGKRLGSIGHMGAFSFNIFKVINSGDGGLVTTDNKDFYEQAFAFHDQGHKPLRKGVEIGQRNIIGINMRMNELTGAFVLGQLGKLDRILGLMRDKKSKFKNAIIKAGIKNIHFRRINDPQECGTLLVVLFNNSVTAKRAADAIGTKTLDNSGWHVYNKMEQILTYEDQIGNKLFKRNILPQTDDILNRAINLSVGVVDPGIGADFGINILSTDKEIQEKADEFADIIKPIVD